MKRGDHGSNAFLKNLCPLSTEVFYFNFWVLKFQFGGEIKIFFAFSPPFSSLYTLFLLKNAPLICVLAVFSHFLFYFHRHKQVC